LRLKRKEKKNNPEMLISRQYKNLKKLKIVAVFCSKISADLLVFAVL